MFCEQQISILEWFLKDHVTLKSNEFRFDIKKYIKIKFKL